MIDLKKISYIALLGVLAAGLTACQAKKKVLADGSSTVFPISEAIAEGYGKTDTSINVSVGTSGTGGGFKRFCVGETDISDASRRIKAEEAAKCKEKNIEYIELEIAYDGLAILVNPANTYVESLTVEQLKQIFQFENPAKTWKDINPAWPADPIKIFAPGQDSGTYDYFVEEIIGKHGRVRADAAFSEDDNVLVTGIAGDKAAIGFFGLAYYEANKDKLKLVPIVNPKPHKAVAPEETTVRSGEYAPLSRPLFIYVSKASAAKSEVRKFVEYYISNAADVAKRVGYIARPAETYADDLKRFQSF